MQVIDKPRVSLLSHSSSALVAESADTLATGGDFPTASVSGSINKIMETKHGGALEHSFYTLHIEGISRALSHEIRIHRYLSFTCAPQRKMTAESIGVVAPIGVSSATYSEWVEAMESAVNNWDGLILSLGGDGWNEDGARSIACCALPQCVATSMIVSGTTRAWRKFLIKRGNQRAQPEMRRLAVAIFVQLNAISPLLWQDCIIMPDADGSWHLFFQHGDI